MGAFHRYNKRPAMRRHLHHPGRRAFLQALAGALGTIPLALSRTTVAQAGPAATRLGERITLITGAGNNVLALAGNNESLLVDAGDAAHATNVREILLKLTGKVSTVINTHYHLESTGGNDAMAGAGAEIAAHLNTKLWMTQEIIRDWEHGKVYPPRAKAALPTKTFRSAAFPRCQRSDLYPPAAPDRRQRPWHWRYLAPGAAGGPRNPCAPLRRACPAASN